MTDPSPLPDVNVTYTGKAGIDPAWLEGRKLLVTRIARYGDFPKYTHVADSDVLAKRGLPMQKPRKYDPNEICFYIIKVLRRGRVREECVEPENWYAERAD